MQVQKHNAKQIEIKPKTCTVSGKNTYADYFFFDTPLIHISGACMMCFGCLAFMHSGECASHAISGASPSSLWWIPKLAKEGFHFMENPS